jgi:hypothetical protein
MRLTQLLDRKRSANSRSTDAVSRQHEDGLVVGRIAQELTDCHSAEHLLVGTHSLGDSGDSRPLCLTCRFQRAA